MTSHRKADPPPPSLPGNPANLKQVFASALADLLASFEDSLE